MTYVELYDRTHLANICATIESPPQRVILVGDNRKLLCAHADRYKEILRARGHDVHFECRCADPNDLDDIISVLARIIDENEDCTFDLTGGGDLYLVAMGVLCERYKHRQIKMHRYNIVSNKVVEFDVAGKTVSHNRIPKLSVKENIRLYGGDVICTTDQSGMQKKGKLDCELSSDIMSLWEICKKDPKAWNKQIGIFSSAETKKIRRGAGLLTEADVYLIRRSFSMSEKEPLFNHDLIEALCERGLVTSYGIDGGVFRIRYKNYHVKKCLTNPGLILELVICLCAKKAKYKNGTYVYNDAEYSVRIDWDGDTSRRIGKYDTENEIDVIMMHGALPVFVSCKNGSFGMEELYKLHSVAHRFGREYSKKVIVATALDAMGSQANHIRQRAKDMNIRLVEGVADLDPDELVRTVKDLWK